MTMLRRILVISGAGILGAAGLALVQIRVGSLFGLSGELDAFFVGAALPSVLLAIGAGTISAFIVPRLPSDDQEATARGAGRAVTLGLLISVPLTGLLVAAAPVIVAVIAPGLDQSVAEQATRVLRIYSLTTPGTAIAFVYFAYGYASGRIWTAGLTTAIYALAWFGLLFVPALSDSVESAALAGLIATGVQVVAAFLIGSHGVGRPWPSARPGWVSRASLTALAAVLGAAIVARSGLLLDPLYGSFLSEGAVSELSFATRIAALAIFVCAQGASYSLLIISRDRQAADGADFRVGLVAPLLLSITAAITLVITGPALAELILARGELSDAEARAVGELLRLWAPSVIAFTLVGALEMMLYAEKRVNEVLWRGMWGLGVNVAASAPLVVLLGAEGRPLGVLAGVAAQLWLLLYLFRRDGRLQVLRERSTARRALAHALAAAAIVAATFTGLSGLVSSELAAVIAILAVGAVTLLSLRSYQAHQVELASAPPADVGFGTELRG